MNKDLVRIEQKLDELLALVILQQKAIAKITRATSATRKPKLVKATAIILAPTNCYEYPDMTLRLDENSWMKIRKGKSLLIKGHGWTIDENDDDSLQDYWSFNEMAPGTLRVFFPDPNHPDDELYTDTMFDGPISECEIVEAPVSASKLKSSTQQR